MRYYALYDDEFGWEKGQRPSGIIVVQKIYPPDGTGVDYHALHWDHHRHGWVYDPGGNADFLGDEDLTEVRRAVSREEAERITPAITGGEGLPDGETIEWIFRWKGQPPRAEESQHRWVWDRDPG